MHKHTKIIATISDKRCETVFIQQLFEAGMNVVRLNTAHLDEEGFTKIIRNVRQVSNQIAILIDTKGPEIRIGTFGSHEIFHIFIMLGTACHFISIFKYIL